MKIIRRHGFRKKRPSFCKEGRFLRGFPIIIDDCNDGIKYLAQIICYRQNVHRQSICSNSDYQQIAKASFGSTRLLPLLLYKHFGPSRMSPIE